MDNPENRLAMLAVASTPSLRRTDSETVRNWIVRFQGPLQVDHRALATSLNSGIAEFVTSTFSKHYTAQELIGCIPTMELIPVDEVRWVVRVCMGLHDPGGPARLVAEYEVLRRLDSLIPIEELQGFPRKLWPIIFNAGA
jgi:hypothetical protein